MKHDIAPLTIQKVEDFLKDWKTYREPEESITDFTWRISKNPAAVKGIIKFIGKTKSLEKYKKDLFASNSAKRLKAKPEKKKLPPCPVCDGDLSRSSETIGHGGILWISGV